MLSVNRMFYGTDEPVWLVDGSSPVPVKYHYLGSAHKGTVPPSSRSRDLLYDAEPPMLDPYYSSGPMLDSHYSSRPMMDSHYSSRPVMDSHYSSRPMMDSHYSSRPMMDSHHSSRSMLDPHHASRSMLDPHYSSRPMVDPHYSSSRRMQYSPPRSRSARSSSYRHSAPVVPLEKTVPYTNVVRPVTPVTPVATLTELDETVLPTSGVRPVTPVATVAPGATVTPLEKTVPYSSVNPPPAPVVVPRQTPITSTPVVTVTNSAVPVNTPYTLLLKVPICCEGCERRVVKKLLKVPGVMTVRCDIERQRVTVRGIADTDEVLRVAKKAFKKSRLW